MTLSDFSLKNPVFAVMLSTAMVVFGYLGYRDLGISQFPEIDFPVVSITTYRDAADPEPMDFDVTDVIEDAIASVEGIDYVQSTSSPGVAVTTVFFRLERDIDAAMQDVQNAVSAAANRLPNDVDPPIISKVNFNKFPVMWLSVHGNRPIQELNDVVDTKLKQQIETIPGCGGVFYGGLRPRTMRIWLDGDKLQSFNLDALDVTRALRNEHVEKPAGYVKGNRRELNVRVMGEARTPEEFAKMPIVTRDNQIIRLGDVAVVEDGLSDKRNFARFNRMPNVGVGVMRATGANVVQVCDEVKARLPALRKQLPEGVEISISTDYSTFIKEDIKEVNNALIYGIILTAFVTYFFLGSIGTTLNVSISIPTSLVGTFMAMKWCNFTINFMTLLALSLSVGVVVDDAILVLENIYRRMEHGEDRKTASYLGAREISFAAIAATFSIAAIFIPVAFMQGAIGRFFFQFGITCTVAVLLSLVISLTITPVLCASFLSLQTHQKRLPNAFSFVLIGLFVLGLAFAGWTYFQAGLTRALTVLGAAVACQALAALVVAKLAKVAPAAPRLMLFRVAVTVGVAVLLVTTAVRLVADWQPALTPHVWPVLKLAHFDGTPAMRWLIESGAEFALVVLVARFGNVVYWVLERFFLEPVLLRPMNWLMDFLTALYAVVLRLALRHKWIVVPMGVALAASALLFVYGINVKVPRALTGEEELRVQLKPVGQELVPSEDQSRFIVNVICPVGSNIEYVDEMLSKAEVVLANIEDPVTKVPVVATMFAAVSIRPGQLVSEGICFVRLVPIDERSMTQSQIIAEARKRLAPIAGMRAVALDLSTQGFTPTRGYPINFAVQGPEWDQVTALSERIRERLIDSGVVTDVNSDYRPGMPEIHVLPDREKAASLGIPIQKIAWGVNVAFGGVRNGRFTDKDKRYDVRLRLQEQQRQTPGQLGTLYLKTNKGNLVPLSDLVRTRTIATNPQINRYNHLRKVELTANVAPGKSQGEAFARCLEIAEEEREKMELPPSYRIVPMGNAQAMSQTLNSMWAALALGFVVAYMILGVQFNSFIHPLTVLLAVPFGVTGALGVLWAFNDTLNLMSMIGMVLLAGLVKKNSIILVDYTNQLRTQGKGLEESVLEACPVRLRPIIMTSLACIASAVPLAMGYGPGAETRAPLARSIIGGMFLSTLVTLVIVPVFYVLFDRFGAYVTRLARREAKQEAAAPDVVVVQMPDVAVNGNGAEHKEAALPGAAAPGH